MKQNLDKKIQIDLVRQYRSFYNEINKTSHEDALLFLVDDICGLPAIKIATDKRSFLKNINDVIGTYKAEDSTDRYILDKIQQTKFYLSFMPSSSLITKQDVLRRGSFPFAIDINEINRQVELLGSVSSDLLINVKKNEILPTFKKNSKVILKALCKSLKLKTPKYKFKLVKSNRPWKNIVTYSKKEKKFIVQININANFKVWETYAYPAHEVCGHVVHLDNSRKKTIFKNNPFLNLICICTQDSFYTESVAQVIFYYLQKYVVKDRILRQSFLLFNLRFLVRHYCLHNILFKKWTTEMAINYHRNMIQHDEISNDYYERLSKDSFFCAQIFNYTYALIKLKPILDCGGSVSKKMIKNMFCEPFTYKGLGKYARI